MIDKKKIMVAIGDSLTYGFPFSPSDSWFELAVQQPGWKLINQGVCGETTGDMLQRFEEDVLAVMPARVIIMGGTNDAALAISAAQVAENIAAMLKMATDNAIMPLIGLPPPIDYPAEEALLAEYRQRMRALAEANRVGVIDFYTAMTGQAGGGFRADLYCDDAHPNQAGYRVMAEAARLVLANLL
ncbi:MAG: GDSL-type esterase/lipase family protein [Negativicutes bacterium]|nr:GDSL-type esterase/lipase family protein [Negativicutes bacterium]